MKVKVVEAKFVNVPKIVHQNRTLRESLEQAEIEICRHKDTIDSLHAELVETHDKLNQLERAVKTQSACWMCSENKICHQRAALPQSPDVGCGKFNFGYRKSEKHSETVCDYKHGKMCWAQKGAPECDPVFCPIKEKKEATKICFNGATQP